jgi:type IV pilus assembly protein PilM
LRGLADKLSSSARVEVRPGSGFGDLAIGNTGLSPEQVDFVAPLAAVPVGLALGGAS